MGAMEAVAELGTVGRVFVLRGAIASESHLLEELCALAREGVADPRLLRKPVRVIAPSRSLREHLSARLVERHGRAVSGISIQTLDGLVASILGRAGESTGSDNALLPALVRQLARREASLRESLDDLSRGYAPVVGEVTDLLDAGLESVHADAVNELIEETSRGALAKRAAAVVRVAARASEQLEDLGIAHLSTRIRRACERIDENPERVLPARAVFVFGYADATGLQMDLIELLLRRCGACVYLDHPADPDEPARPDPGVAFSDRFSARMRGAVGVEIRDLSESSSRPEVRVLRAPGLEAEVRGVANRVRDALDAGVQPERIGVVTRNLDLYRSALRVQFGRLGIPISGIDPREVVAPAVRRRILALQALLLAGQRASLELWLDLLHALPSTGRESVPLNAEECSDLRVAFHASGVARLVDMQRLGDRADGARLRLPRRGLALDADGTPVAPRRKLPAGRFGLAVSAARQVTKHLATWPERAALSDHLDALESLVVEHLCWPADESARTELLARTEAAGSGQFELDREDFWLYFDARTAEMLRLPIGGAGGGVAVLSVEQARSRTFERLFLIGLSREVFPRPIGETPLLPDALRRRLRAVLPDLPVKREGYDEERYLFAQLLSASSNTVVSHPEVDEDGRSRPASPLLERLRSADVENLPGFWQPAECADSRPMRTAYEHAQIAGLNGTRDQFAHALRVAIEERSRFDSGVIEIPGDRGDEARAAARIAVLEEWDPRRDHRFKLGPYYGFLGPIADAADPRRAPLYVTGIEKIARYAQDCPFNSVEMNDPSLGVITSGISYNYVKEAVPDASVLKIGLVFPLPTDLIRDFAARCDRVVVVEELEPYLEEWVRIQGIECEGKSLIPRFGEIDTGTVRRALVRARGQAAPSVPENSHIGEIPVRPPVMCVGCPHRGIFHTLQRKKTFVAGDIGCYTLAVSPPLSSIHTTVCMGAGVSQAVGIEAAMPSEHGKVVAVIGDSTFLHSGMGGVLNMAFNEIPATVIILDNYTTAMTGRQDHPGSGFDASGNRTRQVDWKILLNGLGVEHVRLVDAYDLEQIGNVLEEEIHRDSPSVIVVQGACMLLRNRPVKMQEPYRMDHETCTNCGMCLRIGCPAISRKGGIPEGKPAIDDTQCTGCDLCFQVCRFGAIGRDE